MLYIKMYINNYGICFISQFKTAPSLCSFSIEQYIYICYVYNYIYIYIYIYNYIILFHLNSIEILNCIYTFIKCTFDFYFDI